MGAFSMMGVSQKFRQVLLFGQKWFKRLHLFAPRREAKIPHFLKTDIFNQVADTLYWHWLVFMLNQVWLFVWCNPHQSWSWWNQWWNQSSIGSPSFLVCLSYCILLLTSYPDHLQFQNVCPLFSRWYVTTQYDILVCQCTHYPLHCVKCLLLLCAMSNIMGLKKILPDKK